MNASRTYRRRNVTAKRYPNAADTSYFVNKLADAALSTASCVGLVTAILYLLPAF